MKWENPPERANTSGNAKAWRKEADQLRQHPGTWARLRQYPLASRAVAAQFASRVKNGSTAAFRPSESFEAVTRQTGSTVSVYVRYVGTPQTGQDKQS